jgi:hypothetical protein
MTFCDDVPDQPEWIRRGDVASSFREMRTQLDDAVDNFVTNMSNKVSSEEADEIVAESVSTIIRIGVMSFIQIAQELNEIKHSLNEMERHARPKV